MQFLCKKILLVHPFSKILVARLVGFSAVDTFIKRLWAVRRNELRNAAGLILKVRRSVFMYKFLFSPLLISDPLLHLLWRRHCYGCLVFRSQKQGNPNQNIHGSQNFIHLIFSISLGRFKKG